MLSGESEFSVSYGSSGSEGSSEETDEDYDAVCNQSVIARYGRAIRRPFLKAKCGNFHMFPHILTLSDIFFDMSNIRNNH